jgi:hypothetical protein
MKYDILQRTWNNRKIAWIQSVSSARFAKYSIEKREIGNKLIYNERNGYYDKRGKNVRDVYVRMVPVLEKLDSNNKPVVNEWVHFPDTKEANEYKSYISIEGNIGFPKKPLSNEEVCDSTLVT